MQLIPQKNVKLEYQFFGSSVERGDETQLKKGQANDSKIGPGTYAVVESFHKENQLRTQSTACFISRRASNLFGVIEDIPGPADYNSKLEKSDEKYWSTSIQAFGQTEKRFARSQGNLTGHVPGPGQYNRTTVWLPKKAAALNYLGKKITSFRVKSASSAFKSVTKRNQIDRKTAPPVGTYEESRIFGKSQLEGGAPNNFLFIKNEKMTAPFNSTGKKGWLSLDKGKFYQIANYYRT